MSKLFKIITLLVMAGVFTTSAFAHQQRAAITKVLFNKNTGNLEVMHRFYVHDTEHAVQMIFDKNADIISSKETQEQFAQYVADRFAIKPLNGPELKLDMVGYEIDRQFIWVYQEIKAPENIEGLTIIHNALRDIWVDQINTVNVEGRGELKTATFVGNIELLNVELDKE
ncbi:DUF6702 family protein [Pseudemcibacter aquimaris]|uniref:DUF6702 family protein n=1 Tax=Pseudemcibacter aquimaris TaxID=2857064 RepID=UPI0020120882|nr:DUF6702 family protein [Pseudemcibacter aquimaris]MCC3859790.1 hypothetical protein [Pseudemcibacter aquimaris]WDU60184.1 hypothetical protein KW060_07925 [Pseudemcibacter aquimaris]